MNDHPESSNESFDWDLHINGEDDPSPSGAPDKTPAADPDPAPAPALYPDSGSDEPEFPFPDPDPEPPPPAAVLPPPPSADPAPQPAATPAPAPASASSPASSDEGPGTGPSPEPDSASAVSAADGPAGYVADPSAPLLSKTGDDRLPSNRKRPHRRWLKRILVGVPVLLLVVLLTLAATLYFAGDWAFEKAWPTIDRKLSAQGIYLAYEDIDQTRERGFVLKNIVLYRDANRTLPLATLADVAARVTLGKPETGGGLGAVITFDQSSLALDTGVSQPTLAGVDGAVAVGGGGLAIERLDAEFQGLVFDIAGRMAWPEAPADTPDEEPTPPDAEAGKDKDAADREEGAPPIDLSRLDLSPVDQLVEWVRFDGPGAPVLVNVRFAQEPEEPLAVEASVAGENFNWRTVPFKTFNLNTSAEIGDETKTVTIPTLKVAHGDGALTGRLTADLARQLVQIDEFKSSLDLAGLAAAIHPPAAEQLKIMRYAAPPTLDARGTISLADPIASDIVAAVDFPQGLDVLLPDMHPLNIARLIGTIRLSNSTVATDDLHVGVFGGDIAVKANAGLAAEPLTFSTSIAGTDIALSAIGSLFGEPSEPGDVIALRCEAAGNSDRISISSLELNHGSKKLVAQADLDLTSQILELKSLESTLDLIPLTAAAHPPSAESLAIVTAASGPQLAVQGTVNLAKPPLSRVAANLRSPEGFVLDLSGQPLALTNFATQVTLAGGTATARNFTVDTLGGAVRANLVAKPFEEPLPFAANLLVDRVQLADIAAVAGSGTSEMPGAATITFQGTGSPAIEAISGTGTVKIDDAEFNILPIIGPLFQHLNTLGATFRKGEQSLLEGGYTIQQGVITVQPHPATGEDLTASVSGLQVVAPAGSSLDLAQKHINMDFNVKGTGVTGAALNLAGGKILRITATGPLDNIEYDFGGGVAGTAIGVVTKSIGVVKPKSDGDNAAAPDPVSAGAQQQPPPPPADATATGPAASPAAGAPPSSTTAAPPATPPATAPEAEKKGFMHRLNPFKKNDGA